MIWRSEILARVQALLDAGESDEAICRATKLPLGSVQGLRESLSAPGIPVVGVREPGEMRRAG